MTFLTDVLLESELPRLEEFGKAERTVFIEVIQKTKLNLYSRSLIGGRDFSFKL
jgi:hypothetical protein